MKQQKLVGYQPNYPKKALRGAAMTAAALVAMSGTAGCVRVKLSEPVQTDGMVSIIEPTEEPTLQGKILVTEPPEEELVLDGEVAICEPTPAPQLTTTGMLLMPTPNGQH